MTAFPPRSRRCSACKGTGLGHCCAPCRGTGQQSGELAVCTFCGGTGAGSACHECGGPGSVPVPCAAPILSWTLAESALLGARLTRSNHSQAQHARIRRWLGHWALFSSVALASILCLHVFSGIGDDAPHATLTQCALYAALAVLPGFLPDFVRLVERLVAPLFRLLRAVRELAAGNAVSPLAVDDGDFWGDITADFNRMISRIDRSEPVHPASTRLDALIPLLYEPPAYAKTSDSPEQEAGAVAASATTQPGSADSPR